MDLRVPSGGRGLLAGLWRDDTDDRVFVEEDSADVFSEVSAEDVADALARLFEGSFEYVGLESDDGWIQTADTRGGYVLERSLAGGPVVAHPAVLSADEVREAFLAFFGADPDCGLDWSAQSAVAEAPRKRGWFRR